MALFSDSRPCRAAFLPPCTPRFAGGILRTPPAPLGRGAFLVAGDVPPFGRDGGSRPRPLGASLPPPAACGPLPLPTLGGLGAARPARLRRSGNCGGWSPPSAAQVCAPAGLASRQPLRGGTPPQSKAKPLRGAPAARPCFAPPPRRLRRRCSGPPRPHKVGAVGRCGPPARSAARRPALPAWPRLRRWPGRAALPPPSPPGVAAPPACGVPPPSRGRGPRVARLRPLVRGLVLAAPRGPCAAAIWDAARSRLARFAGRGSPALRARLGRRPSPTARPAGRGADAPKPVKAKPPFGGRFAGLDRIRLICWRRDKGVEPPCK